MATVNPIHCFFVITLCTSFPFDDDFANPRILSKNDSKLYLCGPLFENTVLNFLNNIQREYSEFRRFALPREHNCFLAS
jgi:hypothetical protein